MILVSHPTGNANVRAVLGALRGVGMLARFHTALGMSSETRFPQAVRRWFARRTYEIPPAQLRVHPWREATRLAAGKMGLQALLRHETGWASIDAVCRGLDRTVARNLRSGPEGVQAVYGYEDCAQATFAAAEKLGLHRIYDLPIAYWETAQRLLREEAERLPQWEPTLGGTRDSAPKLQRKSEELALAEVVMCPSRFVLESLPAAARASKHCVVAEFGSPPVSAESEPRPPNGPLRVLFAGSMTQRKGLADVFAALKLLARPDVELVVMGSLQAPLEFYRAEYPDFRYEPPRPHAAVLSLMRSCDVFVLPSLVEGRALVQQEALSCGLPIIVTANAGGDDLIEEGKTGFLVPIRAPEVIAAKIAWCADHRSLLPDLAEAAKNKARTTTWQRYQEKIIAAVQLTPAPFDTHGYHDAR